jgi:transposase
MARKARAVASSREIEKQLLELANSRTAPAGEVQRANIILSCIHGEPIKVIADSLSVDQSTVIRWKNRFLERGLAGLHDRERSGRPAYYTDNFKKAVLSKLEQSPPDGYGEWDGALLARELLVSKDAVWRFLREHRINLARRRTWCVSTEPEFAAKAADVVGLYLDPPEKAVVLCVDEKPNIQALERLTGYAVSSNRKLIQGMESTYKRNGTLNLFAALEVATGMIHNKVTPCPEKTKKGFLKFMDELLSDLPASLEYHVIMDNHSIHKRHEAWLEEHENVFFHYTPTSASWLNMVEIWFGILGRKSLRGRSFTSTEELGGHIRKFVEAYNESAKPFIWRKREIRGGQLKNNARNFCN